MPSYTLCMAKDTEMQPRIVSLAYGDRHRPICLIHTHQQDCRHQGVSSQSRPVQGRGHLHATLSTGRMIDGPAVTWLLIDRWARHRIMRRTGQCLRLPISECVESARRVVVCRQRSNLLSTDTPKSIGTSLLRDKINKCGENPRCAMWQRALNASVSGRQLNILLVGVVNA